MDKILRRINRPKVRILPFVMIVIIAVIGLFGVYEKGYRDGQRDYKKGVIRYMDTAYCEVY